MAVRMVAEQPVHAGLMTTFILTCILMLAMVALLSIRILLVRGGEFRRRCASDDANDCVCGRQPEEPCPHTCDDEACAEDRRTEK